MAQGSNAPRSQEDSITQLFEEIEDKVTKKLSEEFTGTVPETSQNTLGTNQGTNEDDSQNNRPPEAGASENQTTRNSGSDDIYNLVTKNQKEVTYRSPGTSSGKQNKTRPVFQPQVRRESIPATIGADQI